MADLGEGQRRESTYIWGNKRKNLGWKISWQGKQNKTGPHPLNSRSGSATGSTSLLFTLKDFPLVHSVFDVIID